MATGEPGVKEEPLQLLQIAVVIFSGLELLARSKPRVFRIKLSRLFVSDFEARAERWISERTLDIGA
jgi:hypothetical protein